MAAERVRFAPSPTGELHLGGVRTALYDWLIARQSGGKFVLRIEDTDRTRYVPGSDERLIATLAWLGLSPDEGPTNGGPYAPYVQSQRLDRYRQAAEQLINQENAYWCFCTPQRLEELRAAQQANKQPPRYDRRCLNLSADEVAQRRTAGERAVVRHRIPEGTTTVHDVIHGDIVFQHAELDDYVLLKSDGFPTYQLAVVVDDHAMEISMVIRGEEWVSSLPKNILLYQAFGWTPPRFAHPPSILDRSKAKLSKRHGAASAEAWREQGILPEALINAVALLGWNPGTEQEIFSLDELVKTFRLERVHVAGAVFDSEKLLWINQQHMKKLSDAELANLAETFLLERHGDAWKNFPQQEKAVAMVRERARTLGELAQGVGFLLQLPQYDGSLLVPKKGTVERTKDALTAANGLLSQPVPNNEAQLQQQLEQAAENGGFTRGEFFWPLRTALSGSAASPGVTEILLALSPEEIQRRLATALEHLVLSNR
jgi:glutamyl-tRNA synthetase